MDSDLHIMSVEFGSEGIRISYIDRTLQTEKGGIETALNIDLDGIGGLVADIKQALADVVEDFMVSIRNPPDTLPAGPRLHDYGSST